MKLVMGTALVSLLCSAVLLAEDEPKKTPPLDESLKELEWLVGEWVVTRHETQEVAADTPSETKPSGFIYESDDDLSPVSLQDLSIAPGVDGKSLTISYSIIFGGPVTAKCEEVIVPAGPSGSLRGKYDWKEFYRHRLVHEGKGRPTWDKQGSYQLKKTSEECWTGNGSCTHANFSNVPLREPRLVQHAGSFSMKLTKHDNDSFSISLTDRVDMPGGPKDITVHFIRKQKKQE